MNEDQPYFPQAATLEDAWVRARNTWMLAQRHGTLEEGDLMAVGELRRHVKLIDEGGVPLDVVNKAINAAIADALSEVPPQKPDWNAACEAMRWLNDIEAMQGGKNGPSIKLRAAIEAMQQERDEARAEAAALRVALCMIYDKWEDGVSCAEEEGNYIGNAVMLSKEEEDSILALIPQQRDAAIEARKEGV